MCVVVVVVVCVCVWGGGGGGVNVNIIFIVTYATDTSNYCFPLKYDGYTQVRY